MGVIRLDSVCTELELLLLEYMLPRGGVMTPSPIENKSVDKSDKLIELKVW